ncbi:MAG: OmpA family protein [Bacteroidales bacterium]|nr:OmpA family protein [Bacteroidales bacterium]
MKEVVGWSQPTDGSADYFHPCGKTGSRVPDNKFGHREAYHGKAYIGLHLYVRNPEFKNYKEYVMGHFSKKLIKGAKYEISFKVSLADEARYGIDEIGACLTKEPIQVNTYGMIYSRKSNVVRQRNVVTTNYPKPQVVSKKGKVINNSGKWTLISDTVTAKGNEQFIILGSFLPNRYIKPVTANSEGKFSSAYYYFDDVKVKIASHPPEIAVSEVKKVDKHDPLTTVKDSTKPGFTFKLEKIYFEFDKSYLKPESKTQLQELYRFMARHNKLRIEIQGHTDSLGSAEYNQRLSERRALSVKRYLEQKGIDSDRMNIKGYGKKIPIRPNKTEKGRAINRRVIIKILPNQDSTDDF